MPFKIRLNGKVGHFLGQPVGAQDVDVGRAVTSHAFDTRGRVLAAIASHEKRGAPIHLDGGVVVKAVVVITGEWSKPLLS
jgi:hypothetical protein